jgi:hypothetical protein
LTCLDRTLRWLSIRITFVPTIQIVNTEYGQIAGITKNLKNLIFSFVKKVKINKVFPLFDSEFYADSECFYFFILYFILNPPHGGIWGGFKVSLINNRYASNSSHLKNSFCFYLPLFLMQHE